MRPLAKIKHLEDIGIIIDALKGSLPLLVNNLLLMLFFFALFGLLGVAFYEDSLARKYVVLVLRSEQNALGPKLDRDKRRIPHPASPPPVV